MTKKKKSSKKKPKSAKKVEPKTVNVHQVIAEADAAMDALEMDRALSGYTAASSMLKGHLQLKLPEANPILLARVLLKLGECKVALENQDDARQDFVFALSLLKEQEDSLQVHEIRASLLLYLGQLSSQHQALAFLEQGIQELQACVRLREQECNNIIAQDDNEMETDGKSKQQESLQETKRQLSNAYCTVAELFLTDLCFEEGAEQQCEAAVEAAMQITENGEPLVDSLQTMASLRLSQKRGQEAANYMLQGYQKMKRGCEALAALVGLANKKDDKNEAVELTDVDAANNLPGFDFRCQTAKLLMECATAIKSQQHDSTLIAEQVVECSDASIQVLASLLAENDKVIEVWYLMGCAFAAASPPDVEAAAQYWRRALELLTRVKDHMELISDDGSDADDDLQDVNGQIEEVHKRLREIGQDAGDAKPKGDVEMST